MCECVSTMPGITNLPVQSSTVAPSGTGVSGPPTAAILPPRTTTVPFSMVPCVMVRSVAPFRTSGSGAGASAKARVPGATCDPPGSTATWARTGEATTRTRAMKAATGSASTGMKETPRSVPSTERA